MEVDQEEHEELDPNQEIDGRKIGKIKEVLDLQYDF